MILLPTVKTVLFFYCPLARKKRLTGWISKTTGHPVGIWFQTNFSEYIQSSRGLWPSHLGQGVCAIIFPVLISCHWTDSVTVSIVYIARSNVAISKRTRFVKDPVEVCHCCPFCDKTCMVDRLKRPVKSPVQKSPSVWFRCIGGISLRLCTGEILLHVALCIAILNPVPLWISFEKDWRLGYRVVTRVAKISVISFGGRWL